jgi:D-glycero-alpha-D-manno-heptose-7-phosphate kinase
LIKIKNEDLIIQAFLKLKEQFQMTQYPQNREITASAPCRIDAGGTLDIPLFYYTLRHLKPCTFNVALDMRTRVTLKPYSSKQVKITSRGFKEACFPSEQLPFDHPLGLMFAIVSYYRISGLHIHVESSSPPRSALGGSSTAAVALIAALSHIVKEPLSDDQMAMLAYQIESNVARVSCGIQDQLAAIFGGVNTWHFGGTPAEKIFRQEMVFSKNDYAAFEQHILIAYCGAPHESKDINGQWVAQFLKGNTRRQWEQIVYQTQLFKTSLINKDWSTAVSAIRSEVDIRREMTPDVFDNAGMNLLQAAIDNQCAARFTGAGGGGCIWAIGEKKQIDTLREIWLSVLARYSDASLLQNKIADCGVIIEGDNQ